MNDLKLNCAIISPSEESAKSFSSELSKSLSIGTIEQLHDYPSAEALTRLLRLSPMEMLLLDCADFPRAMEIIDAVRLQSPGTEIVAICDEDVKILARLMRTGVRDYIPVNGQIENAREILASVIERLRDNPQPPRSGGNIIAFLPSKPGSGASTIAANTAFIVSSSKAKRRVLLADFDRDAPMQAFLNCLHPEHFLQEAFANAHHMDGDIWSRIISHSGDLDILPCDANGAIYRESDRAKRLLEFFRRAYDMTLIDLPGPLDSCSMDVLLDANRVYLTCTQELASVHIALRKAERLRSMGLGRELRVLLNRYASGHVMTAERVADLVGLPVEVTIPNSYRLANASAEKGCRVDPSTPLGRSYTKLAELFLNERIEIPRKRNKFLEFFYQPFVKQQSAPA